MMLSINAEKAFDKIQYPYDKSSEETRNKRSLPQQNKVYVRKTYSRHYTKCRKTETIPTKVRIDRNAHFSHFYLI
jgi:hypothetical protein